MSLQPQHRYPPEEYLALERKAEYKSEYLAGEIFAMSGASERHNLIALNVAAALHAQFRGRPCKAYMSDMRVKVSPTGLYTYPDVVALCGDPQSSTEAYDRGGKFGHYRKLASLAEYVLISQEEPHIEHYVRRPDNQWLLSEVSDLQGSIQLPSINCTLTLAEVYEKVEFGT